MKSLFEKNVFETNNYDQFLFYEKFIKLKNKKIYKRHLKKEFTCSIFLLSPSNSYEDYSLYFNNNNFEKAITNFIKVNFYKNLFFIIQKIKIIL